MTRVVPPSVNRAASNLISGAVWNSDVTASVQYLTNVPIFGAYANAAQSVASSVSFGSPTPILLGTTIIDSDSGHSNVANASRYTSQVSGWYMVSGTVSWAVNATGARFSVLAKNGAAISGSGNTVNATSFITGVPTATVLVQLNASDYVEIWAGQSSGGALATFAPAAPAAQGSSLYVWWVRHV